MDKTITLRLDAKERAALQRAALRLGTSVSQLVRDFVRQGLAARPLAERTGHLRGRLPADRGRPGDWQRSIKRRNWRP